MSDPLDLFVDTNIFLSFYHFSKDDLEQLRKIVGLCEEKLIRIIIPEQVIDEFYRNREAKIEEAIRHYEKESQIGRPPTIIQAMPGFAEVVSASRDYEKARRRIASEVRSLAADGKLPADELVDQIFEIGARLPITPEILQQARDRRDLGKPPGKKDSLGDAINWECLIKKSSSEGLFAAPMHIVSADSDFVSRLRNDSLAEYLTTEWGDRTDGKIEYYANLSTFFSKHFPDIQLSGEIQKWKIITKLEDSGSYAQTHELIAELNQESDFTDGERKRLFRILFTNSQVGDIIGDQDMVDFYSMIIQEHEHLFSSKNLARIQRTLDDSSTFEDLF